MLFLLNPHRIYESGLFSGSSGKMLAIGRLARHEGGGGVSCPLGLQTEEGQGAGPGKSPTSSPSLAVPTGPWTLFSQGCRNPGTFPLEVASWAFHPRVLGGRP